jgi:predicted  nucleic acid-binding Zn-ribbon protein
MANQSEGRGAGHAMFGLNDPEPRPAAPQEAPPATPGAAPGAPQYIYVQAPPPQAVAPAAGGGKIIPVLVGLLVVLTCVNLYMAYSTRRQFTDQLSLQNDQLNLLARRMDTSETKYAELSSQFQVKLGLSQAEAQRARALAAQIQKQQKETAQQLTDAIAKKASAEELNKLQADSNAKIGSLSGDLAGTQKDLADTKSTFTNALSGTKGELTGAIARTHDELVELAHRTDRDYFEFNVHGKKGAQKVGTVTIQLTKTNVKKNLYNVDLMFDDKSHPHKDRTTNEPLLFYVQGAPSSLEMVVNKMGKDSISGYISAPKGFFTNTPNVLGARPGA